MKTGLRVQHISQITLNNLISTKSITILRANKELNPLCEVITIKNLNQLKQKNQELQRKFSNSKSVKSMC